MLNQWFKNYHWTLVFSVLALCGIGALFIYSASHYDAGNFAVKQLIWTAIGVLVMFIVSHMSYRSLLSISYLFYVFSIIFLLILMFIGETRYGAQRWIHIGPLAVQPSEFVKLATVMALANYLGGQEQWENQSKVIFRALLMTLLPVFLIMRQPDLGTSLLFFPMIFILLFLWGVRLRYLIGACTLGLVTVPLLWSILKAYQKKRILVFLNPNLDPLGAGYTAIQSKIAVGSGGLWGKGYLHGTQGQLNFVPEHHTDFIFCVAGEEWGFMGSLVVLVLYGILFNSIFQVIEKTTDMRAKLIATGILCILLAQVFINIGMSIGLMPITGLTLPLISYGGSSLVTTCIALGLIISIYRDRSIF